MDLEQAAGAWDDALLGAAVFAADPSGLGGVCVRSRPGPVRDFWFAQVEELTGRPSAFRRIPCTVGEDRLLGGLDLAATLSAGRPVGETGVLAAADGGILLLAMAERLPASAAACIGEALERGIVSIQRDGIDHRSEVRFGVIAFDEGIDEDDHVAAALSDRLALHLRLPDMPARQLPGSPYLAKTVARAAAEIAGVICDEDVFAALCGAAFALGIRSFRPAAAAVRAARISAALNGRPRVEEEDAANAARLVLAPRATMLPQPAPEERNEPEPQEDPGGNDREDPGGGQSRGPMEDVVLDASAAAIPPGLLERLKQAEPGGRKSAKRAGAGSRGTAPRRGRPAGVKRGPPGAGKRLNVIETLRAAAPWQPLRRQAGTAPAGRLKITQDDFRISRLKHQGQATTIFVVDASGSSAMNRLAEAKGAVELLLADCYVRRDQVALVAFRNQGAEIALPPTRSLVRAKRSLAALPGGGGTPLAAGIDAAAHLADQIVRRDETPVIVLLTDGRANIAADGSADRGRANEDAKSSARRIRAARYRSLLIDTSPRPRPVGRELAAEMDAAYLPLPFADSKALNDAVRSVAHDPSAPAV